MPIGGKDIELSDIHYDESDNEPDKPIRLTFTFSNGESVKIWLTEKRWRKINYFQINHACFIIDIPSFTGVTNLICFLLNKATKDMYTPT